MYGSYAQFVSDSNNLRKFTFYAKFDTIFVIITFPIFWSRFVTYLVFNEHWPRCSLYLWAHGMIENLDCGFISRSILIVMVCSKKLTASNYFEDYLININQRLRSKHIYQSEVFKEQVVLTYSASRKGTVKEGEVLIYKSFFKVRNEVQWMFVRVFPYRCRF